MKIWTSEHVFWYCASFEHKKSNIKKIFMLDGYATHLPQVIAYRAWKQGNSSVLTKT